MHGIVLAEDGENDGTGYTRDMTAPANFAGLIPKVYHEALGPMIFNAYADDLAARAGALKAKRVLELACGTGIVTERLLRVLPADAKLVATDISEGMLNVAKGRLPADPRVSYQVADACALPFADAAFDAIACQFGVMFFADKVGAMKEARRVLAPGGRYVFNVWDGLEFNPIARTVHEELVRQFPASPPMFLAQMPFGWADVREIERVVRAGGFANVRIEKVNTPCSAPTADEAARGLIDGTPIVAALGERGVSDTAPVRAKVAAVLAEKFGKSPCASTMQAIVVTAW